jgi:tRNA threonylcarbamoyladenosine biosynthesis protein TsaB
MLTLAFDTSSRTASVAILKEHSVIYDEIIDSGLHHSEVLLPAIDNALHEVNIRISGIDLFACTLGPGSFTGLRIGIATLKGFMLATGKPAAGISSLAALAINAGRSSGIICPVMDAGRGQVYTASYIYDKDGILRQLDDEKVMLPGEIVQDKEREIIYIGEGAIKYADIIVKGENKKVSIAPVGQQYIRAAAVGILGLDKYKRKELLNVETCLPVYLRSASAIVKKALFAN